MKTTIELIEPIGREWRDELISLPSAGPGDFHAVDARSGAALPSQTSADGIWARVTLPADQRMQLRVEPGPGTVIESPFRFSQARSQIEISNGVVATAIPASQSFDPGEAPGPILWLERDGQRIGRGTWGASAFTGQIETVIADRGPLFARWTTRYLIDGQVFARYECTLVAGEDFVRVRDATKLGAGKAFRFRLTGDDAPSQWFTYGGGEATTVQRGSMDQQPDHKGLTRGNEFIHIDFNSGHFQMSYTWAGFVVRKQALGICELRGGHWEIPGRNRIHLMKLADGIECVFASDGGSKEFALVCGDPAAYAPETGLSRFHQIRRKYSDLPLEKVRHWVTEWPLQHHDRSILYPRGTAERWQEKLTAWPALAAAYRERDSDSLPPKLVAYLVRRDPAILDTILKKVDQQLRKGVDHALSNGYLRLIIFDGRMLKVALEIIDVLRWRGELDAQTERSFARHASFLAYCFADPDFWPWDSMFRERDDPRSIGADYWDDMGPALCPPNFSTEYYTSFGLVGLAYPEHPAARSWVDRVVVLFERNLSFFFYENGGYAESVNYHAHELSMLTHLAVGLLAAGERDFFEHPRFKRTFGFMIDMMSPSCALTDRGVELASVPHMLNPPKDRRGVLITNWGNSGYDCSGYVVPIVTAIAAGIYADRDHAYAQRLMTAWRMSAQEFGTHHLALHLVAFGRPDLTDVSLNLGSKLVESLGAVMRSGDVFAWIKCGTASNHNCRDEGGMVLYAHGAPIIGDIGYHTQHEGRTEGGSCTWKHACVTFGERRTSAYLGAEMRLPAELWRSTPEMDLLVAYLPIEYLVPLTRSYLDVERVPRIEHRRSIIFVKPHYFVVHDAVEQTTLPSTWWMHALADEVQIGDQSARFVGRYGVDLDVQVVLPKPAKIGQGILGVQRHIRIDQPGVGDYLTVLTPLARTATGPRVHWDAQERLLRVEYAGRTDSIEVGHRMLQLLPNHTPRVLPVEPVFN